MKSTILISLGLLVIISTQAQHSNNHNHTFLVKTDLTKEQIEQILNEYHNRNRNQNQNSAETTALKHKNSTVLVNKEETTQLHQANHVQETTKLHQAEHVQETTQLHQADHVQETIKQIKLNYI